MNANIMNAAKIVDYRQYMLAADENDIYRVDEGEYVVIVTCDDIRIRGCVIEIGQDEILIDDLINEDETLLSIRKEDIKEIYCNEKAKLEM